MADMNIKYTTVSVRLEESEKIILQEFAKEKGMNMSQIIRLAIRQYIDFAD
jgi:antitoxin component of RelBE/YafQ-DinJ toxin-antitoxin module